MSVGEPSPGATPAFSGTTEPSEQSDSYTTVRRSSRLLEKKRPIAEEDEDHIPLKSLLEASKSKLRVAKVVDPNESVNPLEPIESVQSPLGDLIVENPVLTETKSNVRDVRVN